MNKFTLILLPCILINYAMSLFVASDHFTLTPFREGQTAITAYYMAKGTSPFLAYEVPVRGKPWAIPMEFPLFQWLVAQLGGTDLDVLRWMGRLLSFTSWLGCLAFAYLLARRAPVTAFDRRWFLILLASSPIYVAYSTSFLIETFALFFALGYLWAFVRTREGSAWGFSLLAIGFGLLSSLSKPTTWAPFAGVIILIVMIDSIAYLLRKEPIKASIPILLRASLIIGVPLLAGLSWVHFGDTVKMENPLTRGLTSENLSNWNYGTLAQKLSPEVWSLILGKQWILLLGVGACLLPLVGLFTVIRSVQSLKQRQWVQPLWWLLALAGYLSAPIVFTNLHYRHDYYMLANGFFLIAVFVLGMSYLRNSNVVGKWISFGYALTLISMLVAGSGYLMLKKSFSEPQEVALMEILDALPEGPVVFNGFGWSSKMPFEMRRRALMVDFKTSDTLLYQETISLNSELPFVAIALTNDQFADMGEILARDLGGGFNYRTEVWPGLVVLSRSPFAEDSSTKGKPPLLQRVEERLSDPESNESGIVYLHTPFTPRESGSGLFELILRRGGDLFYLDSESRRFYRLRGLF